MHYLEGSQRTLLQKCKHNALIALHACGGSSSNGQVAERVNNLPSGEMGPVGGFVLSCCRSGFSLASFAVARSPATSRRSGLQISASPRCFLLASSLPLSFLLISCHYVTLRAVPAAARSFFLLPTSWPVLRHARLPSPVRHFACLRPYLARR